MWFELDFNIGVQNTSRWWWHWHRHYTEKCNLSTHFACSIGPFGFTFWRD